MRPSEMMDFFAALPTGLQCLAALAVLAFILVLVLPYLKRFGQ